MSEALRNQISVELRYHQQQVDRLQKMLALCPDGATGVPSPASSQGLVGTPRGTIQDGSNVPELKLYKKRTQTPEARRKIGDFQRARHARIRAEKEKAAKVASGKPVK
jgi:hypothetical protein